MGAHPDLTASGEPGWIVIEHGYTGGHYLVCVDKPGRLIPICAMEEGSPDSERYAHLIAAAPALLDALNELVWVIDRAGVSSLANGVQLGQVSWLVKANDRLDAARAAISKATELAV